MSAQKIGPLGQTVNSEYDSYNPPSDEPSIGELWYAKIPDNWASHAVEVVLIERTRRTIVAEVHGVPSKESCWQQRFKREDVEFLERIKGADA